MKRLLMVSALVPALAYAQTKPAPAPAGKPAPTTGTTAPAGAAPAAKPGAAPAAPAGAPAGAPEKMEPPKPGPETDALKPFVKNFTWTGKQLAGAMGPGSPEMPTKGKVTCKWIVNNLWAACDIEETIGTGKDAHSWKGHHIFGWDFMAKEYRGATVGSMGSIDDLKGKLDGAKLSWESSADRMMHGQPMRFRVSFDATDPKAVKFTSEHIVAGKAVPVGEAIMKPAAGK
jgi:hypothetical protein